MPAFSASYAEAMSRSIDACQRTHHSCLEAAQTLMESHPNTGGSKLLQALTHCIGVTRLTAEMLLSNSGSHAQVCGLCITSCRECAELCKGNPDLEACMKSCLECAHVCQIAAERAAA
jgi:hypothetical protein